MVEYDIKVKTLVQVKMLVDHTKRADMDFSPPHPLAHRAASGFG
jgi:hypothetical protein